MPFAGSGASAPLPDEAGTYCGACGGVLAEGGHARCARRLELEPPRYCGQCRRRMKVQVTPCAWTATCVEHGSIERSTWS
jgi:hypothetical protein